MHPNTLPIPAPEVVVAYRYLDLSPVPGRPGEFSVCADTDGDLFGSALDLAREICGTDEYLTTEADWKTCGNAALVAAIEGVTVTEGGDAPQVLVAVHSSVDREVRLFGVESVDCYRLADGDLVPVSAYQASPGRYALA